MSEPFTTDAPTTPTPDSTLATVAPAKVPARMGIAPTTLDEGWRLAQMLAKSTLVPKSFANKPEDVLVAIQLGIEIGLAPMQALQSIAVINGRPSIWGDGFLAIVMGSPLYQDHDEYFEVREGATMVRREGLSGADLTQPTTTAVCTFVRRGKPMPVTQRFTVAAARQAGLMGATLKDGKDGPWKQYPDRMLAMRARSWAGRDCFPDLLRGIRTAEEALDAEVIAPATPIVRQVTRLSAMAPHLEPVVETDGVTVASVPVAVHAVPKPDVVDQTTGEVLSADDIFGR